MEEEKSKQKHMLRFYWDKLLDFLSMAPDNTVEGSREVCPSANPSVTTVGTVEDDSGIFQEEEKQEQFEEGTIIPDNEMSEIPSIIVQKEKEITDTADISFNREKMWQECADLVQKYDSYVIRVESEEAKVILSDISQQLIDMMLRCGGTAIMGDVSFDMIRHHSVPAAMVENGTPVITTLRTGVMIGNRVYVPALVQVKK